MPAISRWPRSTAATASSSSPASARRASSRALGGAPQLDAVVVERPAPGPGAASSSNSGRQSSRARTHAPATRAGRAGRRRSSGSGAISACTRSMASGSSAPIAARSTASPRRSVHRVGAPVLELLVVEEGVRPGGEDLVREHRRLGGVDAVHRAPRPPRCARAARAAPSTSSASCRVSSIVWRTSTWSGISIGPGDVLLAGRRLREHRGHEVVGLHALDGRRVAPAAAEAQHHAATG